MPLGRVDELHPRQVRRRVIEDHRHLDHDLLTGRDIGKREVEVLGAITQIRDRHRGAAALVVGVQAHQREIGARRGEIVPDLDAAQVV